MGTILGWPLISWVCPDIHDLDLISVTVKSLIIGCLDIHDHVLTCVVVTTLSWACPIYTTTSWHVWQLTTSSWACHDIHDHILTYDIQQPEESWYNDHVLTCVTINNLVMSVSSIHDHVWHVWQLAALSWAYADCYSYCGHMLIHVTIKNLVVGVSWPSQLHDGHIPVHMTVDTLFTCIVWAQSQPFSLATAIEGACT
jgi:hypothetical protein